MKVTCFGDSITLGQMGHPYVKYIEAAIENLGVNGLTTDSQKEIVDLWFDNPEKEADAFVLAIGSNDMIGPFLMENGSKGWKDYYTTGDGSKQIYLAKPDDFAVCYRKILTKLKESGKPVVLACPPHLQMKGFDTSIEQKFDEKIKELANEFGFPVVDTKALQLEYFGQSKYDETNEIRGNYVAGIILTGLACVEPFDSLLPKLFKTHLTVDGIHSSKETAKLEGTAINALLHK